jgi:PAS domain S-box-containing protein
MLLDEKRFFDCNAAAMAMFGCATREEFCSKHPADVSPPTQPDGTDSLTLANRQIAVAMEKGSNRFEWIHKREDTGEAFPAEVLLSAMELDGKRVLQATVRDLTKWKQAEETLNKSRAMQRAIFDSTDDFIWAVDAQDFGLLTFNRAFRDYSLRQYGHRLHVGQRPEDLLPNQEAIEHWRGYFQRALVSGPFKTEHLTPSGKATLFLAFNLLKLNEAIYGVSVFGKDITEQKQAEDALRDSHKRLRALTARLESLREEERIRLAREIHDDLGQTLTGLKLHLQWMERKLGELAASEAANALLDRVVGSMELVDAVTAAVQRIASDLRPSALDKLGLGPALQFEARRFEERTGIHCEVRLPEAEPVLTTQQATALFRMFQESLTNVARHAEARTVEVELRAEAGAIILTVQDDGRGITEADIARPESLGLLGMKERAELLGGEIIFQRKAGRQGTVVTARIPQAGALPHIGGPNHARVNR